MGSISAMITSLKNNKRKRVSTFEKMKNFKDGKNIQITFDKKATSYQLKNIREKLSNENRNRRDKNIVIFVIGVSIIIYCIGFVKF